MQVVTLDILAINQNLTKLWVIESHEQANQGGFALAGLANNSDVVIGVDLEVEALEDPLLLPSGVSEPDIPEFNFTFGATLLKLHLVLLIFIQDIDFGWDHEHLEDLGSSILSLLDIWSKLRRLCRCKGTKQEHEHSVVHDISLHILVVGECISKFSTG